MMRPKGFPRRVKACGATRSEAARGLPERSLDPLAILLLHRSPGCRLDRVKIPADPEDY